MNKKYSNQDITHKKILINSVEPNFIFSKKSINRFITNKTNIEKINTNKVEQLKDLRKQINSIQNCNLKDGSSRLILGDGKINSPIMIIGESPGPKEEESNKTFQGESGELIEKMLMAINIKKNEVYSSYAINFKTPENRKPTSQEIKRYSFFLKEHISIIDPKIVILFGSTAMESIIPTKKKFSNERGKWKEIILKDKTYLLICTFSPSYLIRFPENKKFSWEDLKKIRQKILDLKIKI